MAVPDGEPVYCSRCTAPVVLYKQPGRGYRLVCACPGTTHKIDDAIKESNLFDPLGGRWSHLDDIDPLDEFEEIAEARDKAINNESDDTRQRQ